MAEVLNQEFSDRCSYKLFGVGTEKSLIIRKSPFVGAQISNSENGITIEGFHPSVAASLLSNLFGFFLGVAAPAEYIWSSLFSSPWGKFEKEVGLFLRNKYH